MTERNTVPTERPHPAHEKRGIECPGCGCRHLHILYTRQTTGGRIRRRRECRNCGRRMTTYEGL